MRTVLLVGVLVATIGCDRATKHIAQQTLAGTPMRSLLADTVRLEFAENPGGFLSLGASLPPLIRGTVFVIGTAFALLLSIAVAIRWRWRGWAVFGLSLFVAGGLSNWIDRLARGAVVDFINVGIGPLRTGIFNVADVAVMLGAGIVLVTFRTHPTDTP